MADDKKMDVPEICEYEVEILDLMMKRTKIANPGREVPSLAGFDNLENIFDEISRTFDVSGLCFTWGLVALHSLVFNGNSEKKAINNSFTRIIKRRLGDDAPSLPLRVAVGMDEITPNVTGMVLEVADHFPLPFSNVSLARTYMRMVAWALLRGRGDIELVESFFRDSFVKETKIDEMIITVSENFAMDSDRKIESGAYADLEKMCADAFAGAMEQRDQIARMLADKGHATAIVDLTSIFMGSGELKGLSAAGRYPLAVTLMMVVVNNGIISRGDAIRLLDALEINQQNTGEEADLDLGDGSVSFLETLQNKLKGNS